MGVLPFNFKIVCFGFNILLLFILLKNVIFFIFYNILFGR